MIHRRAGLSHRDSFTISTSCKAFWYPFGVLSGITNSVNIIEAYLESKAIIFIQMADFRS